MRPDTQVRVTLETRNGRRVLVATSEREAALMAESVLRRFEGQSITVGFCVDCADREASRRIALYLTDLARELDLA
jgi:hypothetical protein